jgi:DNA-binding beta-propeller fold protein YncE
MNFVSERRDHRHLAMGSALIALAFVAVLAFAAHAQAATENIYWDNYSAAPQSVSVADITGSGGGVLNQTGATLESPEGMAYDTVTNRLFVGSSFPSASDLGQIFFVNLDGSGAGVLSTPGSVVEEPEGVAVDPVTRIIYWTNTEGNGEADGSIGWARLDGTGGGVLNTTGAKLESPYKIALDPVNGRVYWANTANTVETIGWANVNGTGGGTLDTTGAPPVEGVTGLSVDPAGNRIYWLDNDNGRVGFANLTGGGGGEINLAAVTGEGKLFDEPYGLAFDPSIGRLFWGNYGHSEEVPNAIGFANLAGGNGGISPATAPVNGPQDPVILKSPTGTGTPKVTRNSKDRSKLNCSTGSWAADYPGSFVYQAPRTFAYQWTRDSKAIKGATASTYNAKSAGSYGCIVTAANQTGSAAQTSKGLNVKAAKLKLSTKKKANGKPGKVVSFKVKATNQGDIKSGNAKVCVKLPGSAKGALKAPKCKSLGKLKGQAKKSATLKIKVLPSAGGTYKVKFQVKGAPGKAAKAKIIVG